MTERKDWKRRVRARMERTGESYTTARTRLLARRAAEDATPEPPPAAEAATLAECAGMSDDAVRAKTGKTWAAWVAVLDRAGAHAWTHREIARSLHEAHGLPGWWAQTVTVGYERIRGLREKGQRRDGSHEVNKSRTFAVSVARLYRAFLARERARWLGDLELEVRTSRVEKSLRMRCADGTPVEAHFWVKGPERSQVQLQHRKLSSRAEAERVRAAWTARLEALAHHLASR